MTRGRGTASWFSWALFLSVFAALLEPRLGSRAGPLDTAFWIRAGTVLVFFLHGTRLPLATLGRGVLDVRSQLVAQGVGFVLLPLLAVLAAVLLEPVIDAELRLGLLFLCALPTTVTSAAVLAAAARGNVAVAVVGSTLSGLLGVLATPAWVALFTATTTGPALLDTVGVLLRLLVLPLLVGQLCRALWRKLVRVDPVDFRLLGFWRGLGVVDRVVVLLIVYTVFCDAFHTRLFSAFAPAELAVTALLCGLLLAVALGSCHGLGLLLGLGPRERIAAMFVGSTKSLAIGVPMAAAIFGAGRELGALLLPLLVYHPLQLLVGSAVASRQRGRPEGSEGGPG